MKLTESHLRKIIRQELREAGSYYKPSPASIAKFQAIIRKLKKEHPDLKYSLKDAKFNINGKFVTTIPIYIGEKGASEQEIYDKAKEVISKLR